MYGILYICSVTRKNYGILSGNRYGIKIYGEPGPASSRDDSQTYLILLNVLCCIECIAA